MPEESWVVSVTLWHLVPPWSPGGTGTMAGAVGPELSHLTPRNFKLMTILILVITFYKAKTIEVLQ